MTDNRDPNDPNDDLEGFDTFDEPLEEILPEDEPLDDAAMDADFQDLPDDDLDAEVFGEGEPAEPAAKKKTNWFNIGVAVVAIAVAGGLVWSKLGPTFSGASGPSPMPMAPISGDTLAQANPKDSAAAAQQALAPMPAPAASAQGGLLDDPEKFAQLAQNARTEDGTGEKHAVIADPFAGLPPTPTQAAQADADVSAVPMPAPITAAPAEVKDTVSTTPPAAPAVTTPLPEETAAPVETVMPAAPAPATAPAADTGALEGKMASMENRLDALDAKIDSAIERLDNAPSADDSRLASIQTALERLESRLDKMATTRSASAPARSDETPAPVKRASAPKKAASKPKAASKYDAPYSPPSQAVPASSTPSTGGWELRGAQPGRAIIAKGSDIREVGVGETVPGLGEIMGVAQVNGLWVVQGSQGRLSQ